jgi:hypothetical protein
MRAPFFAALMLIACEPPPEVDVAGQLEDDVSISIVYPPLVDPEGGPFRIKPDANGDFFVKIVVDVTGFELVDPYADPPPPNAEDEGHWHADLSDGDTIVSFARFGEIYLDGSEVTDGDLRVITVTVRQNDHGQRDLEDGAGEDTVEIRLDVP